MRIYWYLSMTPESLVASMLPPEEFGNYLAIGTHQSTHGQAIFFDLDLDEDNKDFDYSYALEHCTAHPDGKPKHSLYMAIYRVLERMPLQALNSLWMATEKGKVLELKQAELPPSFPGKYHLYQELCPVHPLVASNCPPAQFCHLHHRSSQTLLRAETLLRGPRTCRPRSRSRTRQTEGSVLSRSLRPSARMSAGIAAGPPQANQDRRPPSSGMLAIPLHQKRCLRR